ncbi:TorF family putative porin [Aliiglaciecola sp. CAU 1673]|uniref:TorF family putative porin n=1 Tax=Aliiglaciecola sp. CAU 1673 TaxID=3032595 RepID=UPI0023DABCB1|nr:TorF family putative porin [Aliiglaciecola sp. CAU 1673]MDF2178671.1 TorF family putative porin [Aliiglaciecola sp. CAU 1673]
MKANQKKLFLGVALGLCAVSSSAMAEVSANFGVTSNYLWRGVTQSADGPSVSGGLDYSHESGFYAGTWLGSVDWGNGNGSEVDLYLGYSGESEGFGYDVGYIYYHYPETEYDDSDFGEVYFNGSFGDLGFGLAYTTNSDADDDAPFADGDLYYHVSYGFALPEDYSLTLTYGYYSFDVDESVYGDWDYGHFQVDVAKGDFTFTVSKADEDSGDDDTKFVVSWGTSF